MRVRSGCFVRQDENLSGLFMLFPHCGPVRDDGMEHQNAVVMSSSSVAVFKA